MTATSSEGQPHRLQHPHFFTVLVACLSMLAQFSIATYMPAFDAMARDLGVGPVEMQHTLTAYLLPFAFMVAWHGAISDAIGRRRMILAGLALYALGSLLCAFTSSITVLYLGRAIQGFSAAIGVIVGRAMVCDCYDGPAAQRQMALVSILYALAPALAPVAGGWLLLWTGWRSIFLFLAVLITALLAVSWWWLPETLPPAKRHSLHPIALARAYAEALTHRQFLLFTLGNAGVNMAIYLYVYSAPMFVTVHLGLNAQSFAWLFVPIVVGMVLGSLIGHRMAGRISPLRSVAIGHGVMLVAGVFNIALAALHPPGLPWSVLALPVFSIGMMITQPGLQLLALDCLPHRGGLASSGYVATQQILNALSVSLLIPVLMGSTLHLALGMLALQLLGGLTVWVAHRRGG